MKKSLLILVAFLYSTFTLQAQWAPQTSNITAGYYAQFIDAVNENICWGLVSDPTNNQNPVQEFTRTINGGLNWIDGQITNCAGRCPSSIFALNADTAWTTMYSGAGGPGTGAVMRTSDGGATWTQQTTALFSATGNFPDFIYFWDANNGVCLGDPVDGYFEIYTTTDGGTNWLRAQQAEIPPQLNGEFGITDVFTADHGSTLWFGTNFGRIYKTTDKGYNWSVAQTPFADFIGAIAFRDANNGLCTSGGATGSIDVARTTDGGATWSLVGTNTAGMTLKGGMCYVPGSDSTYFISTPFAGTVDGTTFSPNDGNAWVPVDNLIHTDIEFVNDSTGWTGSNELNAPMFKWSTPIILPLDDAASQSIDISSNTGLFTQTPKATFLNAGLNVETFDVTMEITGGYSSTKTVTNLPFYNTVQIDFDPWTPATTGAYLVKIYTSLGPDSQHGNDTTLQVANVFDAFQNCGWVSKPDVTSGTFGSGNAFVLDGVTSSSPGRIFSLGGNTLSGSVATNNVFSDQSSMWAAGIAMPTAKVQFSAQVANGKIICAGGYSTGFTPDPITYIYDIANSSWSTGAPMPVPVGDYACGMYKDSLIYYVNGFDGAADEDLVQIYDVYNNSWSTGTVTPLGATEGSRGAVNGSKFIFVGGFSAAAGGVVSDAYVGDIDPVNPGNINWSVIDPYPAGPVFRPGSGTVFMDFKPMAIFVGGDPLALTGADKLQDCWGYDFSGNVWLIGPAKPTVVNNLMDFRGLIYNDTLWMAAVAGYDGAAPVTANEWLCLGAQVWTGISESPATSDQQLTIYPDPATERINISSEINIQSVSIYNVLGALQIIQKPDVMQHSASISIGNLPSGVYTVMVKGEKGICNTTFVKQ